MLVRKQINEVRRYLGDSYPHSFVCHSKWGWYVAGRRQHVSDGFRDLKLSVVFEGEDNLRIVGEIQVRSFPTQPANLPSSKSAGPQLALLRVTGTLLPISSA